MPFPALSKTTQKRAIAQASSNTESSEARVVKTYADALGNITAADVVVKGQVASLVHVANASGIKLYNGATVEVRSLTGNVHARQITGAAGSSTTGAISAQQAADSVAVSGPPPVPSSLSDAPVLLQSASTGAAGGYVEVPGSNVIYTDTDPGTGSGGAAISGQRLVDVKPLVVVSLPAVPTTLRDGTLVCLIDSYGGSQGLWRLDGAAQVWRRVDVGSVKATAATFGTVETDITEASGSIVYTKTTADSTFATQTALAQTTTEVVAARTRTVKAISYTSAEGRLDAMEVDIAANVRIPHSPAWWMQGIDNPAPGAVAFNPSDISPTWAISFDPPSGDLFFSQADGALTPIAWEQHVILYTRLKVATAKTIQITVRADNACRVFLNGVQVGADANDTNVVYTLNLLAGWNTLVLCYENGDGDTYELAVAGVGGPLTSLVDRMAGYLPVPKRGWALRLPVGTTAASTPDLTTVVDVPYGPNGASINWLLESVTLHVETPNANPTMIMPVWAAGGNATFGAGTNLLSTALSAAGASTYSAAAPAANLSTNPVPSGSRVALIVSAAGGSNARVSFQWRES